MLGKLDISICLFYKQGETAVLNDTPITEKVAVAVDLGINNACTCSIMYSDGTVAGRHFLKLPAEEDSLNHAINRIKKAQQHSARKMPRLWGKAKGINQLLKSLPEKVKILRELPARYPR